MADARDTLHFVFKYLLHRNSRLNMVASFLSMGLLFGCGPTNGKEPMGSPPTWEEFREFSTRKYEGGTFYVVEGDIPVTLDQLRSYYEDHIQPGNSKVAVRRDPLIVNQTAGGDDDLWTSVEALDIRYCVSNAFSGNDNYDRAVEEIAEAAESWETFANVRFHHVEAQDNSCDLDAVSNDNVDIVVRPYNGGGACAAFPSCGRNSTSDTVPCSCVDGRQLAFDFDDFDTNSFWDMNAPNMSTIDAFRHELGHVLGFRHEYNRDTSGCYDDNNWRPLTDNEDPDSVMHYPWCPNGNTNSEMTLAETDQFGSIEAYGLSTPLVVASVL